MNNYKITLEKIQTAFYSDRIGPAIFPKASVSQKHSKYPGPKQYDFCTMLFPQEIMNNPNQELNTLSMWRHRGSLSMIMRGAIINPTTGYFHNGFKQFNARIRSMLEDPKIINLLIQQCDTFLTSGGYDYENFCRFFHTEISEHTSYFKPNTTHLFQLVEENPAIALAFFLIFALLDTDAVSIIEQYLNNPSSCELTSESLKMEAATRADISSEIWDENSCKSPHNAETDSGKNANTKSSVIPVNYSGRASAAFEVNYILPSNISNFCGRTKYLKVIHQYLHSPGENPHLFLYGMSGIGKTELAKKYAATYKDYYDTILFLDYQGSLCQLVCNEILLNNCKRIYIDGKPESNERFFIRKLRALWGISSERVLFIIDNFNVTEDPDLREFLKGNYAVLFTTQTNFSENGYRVLPVSAFENFGDHKYSDLVSFPFGDFSFHPDELLEPGMTLTFFKQNYGKPLEKDELPTVQKLLSMFNGHLFVLELIARQMRASRLTAAEMFDFLKHNGIYATRNLDKIKHYSSNTPQPVYEYVKHIVSAEHLSCMEQYILKNLALLPVSGTIDRNLKIWCELENYEIIEQLIAKSLIRCDQNTGLLFLHPLIHELILVNLHPKAENVEALVKNIALTVKNSWSQPRERLEPYDAIVYSLLTKLDSYTENTLRYYEHLLEFGWQCGHFELVIKKANDAYRFCRVHRLDHEISGSIARAAGNCCYSAGIQTWADSNRWYRLMWHHYHTKKQGYNKGAIYAAQRIAKSYLNQAIYCQEPNAAHSITEHALHHATSWTREALKILEALTQQEKNTPDYSEYMSYCGDAHYMNACIFLYQQELKNALSEARNAIACYLFPDGRIRSTSITAAKTLAAKALTECGQFDQANLELKEAYDLELDFRGIDNNSHLIRIYIAQGDLYCRTGKISLAVTCYQKAIKLIQQIYTPGNGRYFNEVSAKLLLCEDAREKVPLMVRIETGL